MTIGALVLGAASPLEHEILALLNAFYHNAHWLVIAAAAIGVAFEVLKRLKANWWLKLSHRMRTTVVILAGGVVAAASMLAAGKPLRDAATLALAGVIATSGYKLLRLWGVIDGFDGDSGGDSGGGGAESP